MMELTATERKLMISALETYRKIKGAEGKLKEHAALRTSKEDAQSVITSYNRLQECIATLQKKLGE